MKSNKFLLPQVRRDSENRFPCHLHIERKMKKLIENPRRSWREKTANFNEFDDFHGSLKVNYIIIQFGYISEANCSSWFVGSFPRERFLEILRNGEEIICLGRGYAGEQANECGLCWLMLNSWFSLSWVSFCHALIKEVWFWVKKNACLSLIRFFPSTCSKFCR